MIEEKSGDVVTIADFCKQQRISRFTFRNWSRKGLAPKVYKVGRLVRISGDAYRQWKLKVGACEA